MKKKKITSNTIFMITSFEYNYIVYLINIKKKAPFVDTRRYLSRKEQM
jgi:hypothetical protein